MSLADGRIWRNVLPTNPRIRRKRPSRFFFFSPRGRAYSVSYMAPSREFPCATITALRVVENIFPTQLSSARQRRSASSFFFRPSRDLATFVSTASLRISLSFFYVIPSSVVPRGLWMCRTCQKLREGMARERIRGEVARRLFRHATEGAQSRKMKESARHATHFLAVRRSNSRFRRSFLHP